MTTQPVVIHISVYVYIHTYVYCAIHIRIIDIILYFQFQDLSSFLDMCASPCPARGTRAQFAFKCFLQAAVERTTPSWWLYLEKQKWFVYGWTIICIFCTMCQYTVLCTNLPYGTA